MIYRWRFLKITSTLKFSSKYLGMVTCIILVLCPLITNYKEYSLCITNCDSIQMIFWQSIIQHIIKRIFFCVVTYYAEPTTSNNMQEANDNYNILVLLVVFIFFLSSSKLQILKTNLKMRNYNFSHSLKKTGQHISLYLSSIFVLWWVILSFYVQVTRGKYFFLVLLIPVLFLSNISTFKKSIFSYIN